MNRGQMIERAFALAETVSRYAGRVRAFFYRVALFDRRCPCCNAQLRMTRESRCRCPSCETELDPTVTYQRCACGGAPRLRIRRYECSTCGAEMASHFVFDGLIFEAKYFRKKMAESRQRRREQHERVRRMLAGTRSGCIDVPAADLAQEEGLLTALDQMVDCADPVSVLQSRSSSDLKRYQRHIQAHIRAIPSSLEQIPPMGEDLRIDRIGRFIAIIFLAHAGILDVWQNGQGIMVKRREVDREGQEFPGDVEELDAVEGSLGGAEA